MRPQVSFAAGLTAPHYHTNSVQVGGFGSSSTAAVLPSDSGPITFFNAVVPWLTLFNGSSCVAQVYASSLIAWKVWTVLARDPDTKPRSCGFVGTEGAALRIGIEAGMMRTLCAILLLPLVSKHIMAAVIVSAVSAQVDVGVNLYGPDIQLIDDRQATASYLIIIRTESLRSDRERRPTTGFLSDIQVPFESVHFTDVRICNQPVDVYRN